MAERLFHWLDYAFFVLTLVVSLCIGVYYAIQIRRRKIDASTEEFLVGGRKLGFFPVALSMFVTFMSPIGILGTASEIYSFGGMYWLRCIGLLLATPITAHLILPIYHRLQLTSAYEYFELRFNKPVRMLISVAFIPQVLSYLAMVLYTPALALSQVSGLPIWLSIVIGGSVCVTYTSIGGMRAVVWSDVFQSAVMFLGLVVACIFGTIHTGGLGRVFEISAAGGRMPYFEFSLDPFIRHTFWTLTFGAITSSVFDDGGNQVMIQRFLSVGKLQDAQKSAWITKFIYIVYTTIQCYSGLVTFAYYHNCDPLLAGRIDVRDQIFSLHVMDILHHLPGIPGLFLSCLLSAALSTISSGLNSLAAVLLKDIIQPLYLKYKHRDMSPGLSIRTSIVAAVLMGILAIGGAILVQHASQMVLQLHESLWSMVSGPTGGVLILAVFFPCVSSLGTGIGFIAGFIFITWISLGAILIPPSLPFLGFREDGCNITYTNGSLTTPTPTLITTAQPHEMSGLEKLYSLSYQHYTVFGSLLTIVVALIISAISGFVPSDDVDANLYYPVMSKLRCWKKKAEKQLIQNRDTELMDVAQNMPLNSPEEQHGNSTDLYKKPTLVVTRPNNTALG